MKIRSVEPILCKSLNKLRPWILVKITTDSGAIGYGDCTDDLQASAVVACVRELGERIVGRDPMEIENIYWSHKFRSRGASQRAIWGIAHKAISGIDAALYDLKGKVLGVPVYELLGGKMRDTIPVYWSHCGSMRAKQSEAIKAPKVRSVEDLKELGKRVIAEGYTAIKTNIFPMEKMPLQEPPDFSTGLLDRANLKQAIAIVSAFRESLGPDIGIALDIGFSFRMGSTLEIARAMEPFNLLWLETETMDVEALKTVRMSTRTPICSGHANYTARGFKPFLEAHAQDYIIVDISMNGLTMGKKIADLTEVYDSMFTAHNTHSPIGTLIAAHLSATVPNMPYMEFNRDDVPWRDDIISSPIKVENGCLVLPDGPGLGVDLNEAAVAKLAP